eukprot:2200611-Rhodomonas_salina.1
MQPWPNWPEMIGVGAERSSADRGCVRLLTRRGLLLGAQKAVSRNAEMADIEKIIKHSIASAEDNKQNKVGAVRRRGGAGGRE